MASKFRVAQPPKLQKYGLLWEPLVPPLWMEMQMITRGGQWARKKGGGTVGNGLYFHFREALKLCWPEIVFHRWLDLFIEQWLTHKHVGVLGPKNASKTNSAAICHLLDYYCFPVCTTTIVCSTTKESLENRIWGEMKKYHRLAKQRFDWLPGHLIEGRMRIVTDDRDEVEEGRDFRNGLMGLPLLKGNQYIGISALLGIKNKRVRLCGDEVQLLPKAFIDATANLSGNADFRLTGMGNPAQTTDSLGILCEPHHTIGGWDGGIDQTPKTKVWKTRFDDGICIQFPGSDSPNHDGPKDQPPKYPFLITPEQIAKDALTWGKDDWHFLMFDEGMMPRGQGSRRVITRQLCIKHRALEEPLWASPNRTKITSLDAAYRSVGGDRCVFMVGEFGQEAPTEPGELLTSSIIKQSHTEGKSRTLLALKEVVVIPIKASDFESPEDQIVMFVKQQHERLGIPPENFFYDAGMRTSLVTAFGRLWSTKVNSIDCGGRPSERPVSGNIDVSCRDYYSKFVTELWYSVRLTIEAEQFRGMTEDVMNEGCAREWKTVGGNKIEVETKAEMKEKIGRSPDLFDCLAILTEGARQKGFVIHRLGTLIESVTDQHWKTELREKAQAFWHGKSLTRT